MSYKKEIIRIYSTEGVKGFLRGYQGMFIRDAPGFGIYFSTYEFLKRSWGVSEVDKNEHNYHGMSSNQVSLRLFLGGGFSGMATWFICYPADHLKTRLQT